MTNTTMRRQIDQIKEAMDSIKPRPRVRYTLLAKPHADASAQALAAHKVDLEAALVNGGKVIYLVGVKGLGNGNPIPA